MFIFRFWWDNVHFGKVGQVLQKLDDLFVIFGQLEYLLRIKGLHEDQSLFFNWPGQWLPVLCLETHESLTLLV